jgi:hypothetical protein
MMERASQIARALIRAFHTVNTSRRIRFSKDLYFQIPDLKLTLFSGSVEFTQSMELSIPEAKAIFQSIKSAYELRELQEIKVGGLSWTTDGRVQPTDPDRIAIKFNGPLGYTRTVLKREDVAAALEDFDQKIILPFK